MGNWARKKDRREREVQERENQLKFLFLFFFLLSKQVVHTRGRLVLNEPTRQIASQEDKLLLARVWKMSLNNWWEFKRDNRATGSSCEHVYIVGSTCTTIERTGSKKISSDFEKV